MRTALTKQEALKKIEEARANIEALQKYVQEEDTSPAILCETFATKTGKTGVIVQFPEDVTEDAPVTEYMIRDFIRRGGKVWDAEGRIERWNHLRFCVDTPLYSLWKGSVDKTYEALPPQPTARSLAGRTFVFLLDTARDVQSHPDMSFYDVMDSKIDVVNPIGWLGLLISTATPSDESTYLAYDTWEWIGALLPSYVAGAVSDSDGLVLYWNVPGSSWDDFRVRSSVS